MYGIDISKWQRGIDLTKAKYDFCIFKATEGYGYTDPAFVDYAVQLTKLDKLMGFYHYARPDLHKTYGDMEKEAKWFVETIEEQGLVHKGILVLDWEKEPFDNEGLVSAWLEKVVELTGIIPFIYGSRSKLTRWKDWDIIRNYPTWIAVWPTINNYQSGEDPGLKHPSRGTIPWSIWQYSSKGRCAGYPGDVDLDYTDITETQWKEFAGYVKEPVEEQEKISSDMKWAIDMGLFVGYPDGTYKPREPLTREQAASLFRRFSKQLQGLFE